MKITYSSKLSKHDGILILPLFENDTFKQLPGVPALDEIKAHIHELSAAHEFESKEGQAVFVYKLSKNLPDKIVLVGMGSRKKLSVGGILSSLAHGIKTALPHGATKITIVVHEFLNEYTETVAEAVVMGAYLSGLPYKTGEAKEKLVKQELKNLEILGDLSSSDKALFEKGLLIGAVTNQVRDWINAPPNYAHIDFFLERAKEIAKMPNVTLKVLDKSKLEKLGMGAIMGVNRGSNVDARMIMLEYSPKNTPKNQKPIVLVGKGILFDSGGYNLKPSGHIEDMHLDKSGAATVLATIKVLSELKYSRKVVAIAPMTDNLIGPDALRPSEILTTYSGKTVEVLNTDAEGRLILSDAVAYGVDIYKPEMIIDLATLTGACMIALGERYAGLFSNNDELADKLYEAGQETDELLWKMPIHDDDAAKMKGTYADLRNSDTGSSRLAGASKGAAFIKEFIGETPWAHLDIAGPAFVSDPKKYESKGATGFGVRVLIRFLENLANG